MKSRLRNLARWSAVGLVALVLLSFSNGTRYINPAQEVASPYLYNIVEWELGNFFSKWIHRLESALPFSASSDEEKRRQVWEYFRLGEEFGRRRYALNQAAAQRSQGHQTSAIEAELEGIRAQQDGITVEVEEAIEASISSVMAVEGLTILGDFIFPPVDIRLGDPPKLLVTSPRDRIERTHDVLLRSRISLEEREQIEYRLFEEANLSALVEDIGGLATYPASIPTTQPMRWTIQTAAHEWLHHYFFFRPLGQNMFKDGDMLSLNETIASIVGREIGDRAFVKLGGEIPTTPPESQRNSENSVEEDEDARFDFSREMRETRLRVEELLAEGHVEEAEAYMEQRRRLFVENGYAIRKLNQAYFAFYGTYADTPASISPIGGQVQRFRELVPDLGDFIRTVAGISSYQEFLDMLEELESRPAESG